MGGNLWLTSLFRSINILANHCEAPSALPTCIWLQRERSVRGNGTNDKRARAAPKAYESATSLAPADRAAAPLLPGHFRARVDCRQRGQRSRRYRHLQQYGIVIQILLNLYLLNGLLLPIILFAILSLVNQKRLMGRYTNTRAYNVVSYTLAIVVSGLAILYLVTQVLSFFGLSLFG